MIQEFREEAVYNNSNGRPWSSLKAVQYLGGDGWEEWWKQQE